MPPDTTFSMTLPHTPEAPSVGLADLLSNRFAPIKHTLLGMLDARDEANLKCVSKALHSFSDAYRNWDYILEKYFASAKGFRSLQAQWNAFVVGDVVIDLFAGTKSFIRKDPHLVFIVPEEFVDQAENYLEEEGYTEVPEGSGESLMGNESRQHLRGEYVHSSRSTSSDNRVRVLLYVTDTSPAFTFLNCDWVPLSMCSNFVTWNKGILVVSLLDVCSTGGFLSDAVYRQRNGSRLGSTASCVIGGWLQARGSGLVP
jgi:hypothetical protein